MVVEVAHIIPVQPAIQAAVAHLDPMYQLQADTAQIDTINTTAASLELDQAAT
jgi:hypothetical protein